MKFKKFKFKKVRSTNNTAIRIIKKTNCKYGMVISESQTNGKGQYGRKWISYKGNLFVTFFHEVNKIKFQQDTVLVCYTDGLVELENNNGVPFETDNLIEVVENNFNLTMNELDQKIFEKLDDFKGDQKILDDTAVMSCKFYI